MYLKVKIVEIWIFVYKFDSQVLSYKIHLCKQYYKFYMVITFCKKSSIIKNYSLIFKFLSTSLSVCYRFYLKWWVSNIATFGPIIGHNWGNIYLLCILIYLFSKTLTHIIYCYSIAKLQFFLIIAAGISVAFL